MGNEILNLHIHRGEPFGSDASLDEIAEGYAYAYMQLEKDHERLLDAMKELVKVCPTSLTCENVNHNRKGDLHGAEEDCPPLCRYYKALDTAQSLLSEI